MIFKTWLSDINKVAISLDSLRNIRFDSNNIVTTKAYTESIRGLNEEQARYVLSKRYVSEADQNDLLIKAGVISANEGIEATELSRQLILQGLNKEMAEALIEQEAGNKAISSNTVLTKEQTASILEQTEARKLLSAEQRKNIANDIKETTTSVEEAVAEETQAVAKLGSASSMLSRGVSQLGKSFTSFLSIFVSSPVAIIATIAGSIIGLTYAIGKLQDTAKNAADKASEFSSSMSSANSAYNTEKETLEELTEKYKDLRQQLVAAKGNEEETYNIKSQLLDLQKQLNEIYGDEYDKVNLVTDAYKVQTDVLEENAKQKAQNYLNEHTDEIETATKKMTTEYTYEFGNFNYGIADANIGNELHDQIEQLAEKNGIEWDDNKGFVFKGTAEEASKTINQFMSDVRELKNSRDDLPDYFDDNFQGFFSDMSKQLGYADDILNGYKETYETAQMAQIASNTELSKGYNEAVSAVDEYNEAILNSEDPYNDENVKEAWDNLQTVKQGIKDNEDEWGQYSNIMDNVFAEADDDIYSFYNVMQNDNSLLKMADDLRGLSDTDLQSMADDDIDDSFDKLCEKAKEYGLEVQDVIDLLVELGYVQGEVQGSTWDETDNSFLEVWDSADFADAANELLDLAKSGEITAEVIESTEEYTTLLTKTGMSAEGAKLRILEMLDATEKLSAASQGMDSLSTAFDEWKDKGFVTASTLDSLPDAFKKLDGYDLFSQIVGDPTSGKEKIQQAFDDIATEYVKSQNVLGGLTEENKEIYIANLKEIGIANAEEVVDSYLASKDANTEILQGALKEYETYLTSKDEEDLKYLENQNSNTQKLIKGLGSAYQDDYDNWIKILEEKKNAYNTFIGALNKAEQSNNKTLTSSTDNLMGTNYTPTDSMSEVSALGLATQINNETAAMVNQSSAEVKEAAANFVSAATNANSAYKEMELDLTQTELNLTGGNYTGSSDSKSKDKSGSDSKETFDWIETKISRLERIISNLDATAENTAKSLTKRTKALGSEITKITSEITLQQKAADYYLKKANSIGLSSSYKKLVQNGAIKISEISDDNLKEKIQEYQDYYEKYLAALDKKTELTATKIEKQIEKIQLKIDSLNNSLDTFTAKYDRIEDLMSITENSGSVPSYAKYQKLNTNLAKQYTVQGKIITQLTKQQSLVAKNSEAWYEYQDAINSAKDSQRELTLTMIENAQAAAATITTKANSKIEKYDNSDELYDAKIENAVTASSKNAYIDKEINNIKKRKTAYDTATSQSLTRFQSAQKKLNNYKSTASTKTLLKNIKTYTKKGEQIPASLLQKASQLSDLSLYQACVEYNADLAEYVSNKQISDVFDQTYKEDIAGKALEQFNNINTEYENKMAANTHETNMINESISQTEARGHLVAKGYYQDLMDLENANITSLESKYTDLSKSLESALDSGEIQKYSDEWYEMVSDINSVAEAIAEANTNLINYEKTMRQLDWDIFDMAEDSISKLADEANFLIDLMSNNDMYEDNGTWTEYATATSAMHGVNYNTYMAQADDYAKEIQDINKQLAEDPYDTKLIERKQELISLQQKSILAAEQEKQAIKELVSEGYQTMINYLQELSDQYIDALQKQKDLYDYQKSIEEKTKARDNIQKQLIALSGDTSEETRNQIQQLQNQLKDANEDLEEAEYEQYLKDQQQMLDTMNEDAQDWMEEKLTQIDMLIEEQIRVINDKADEVKDTIDNITNQVGYLTTDEMNRILNTETGSVGNILSVYSSNFSSHATTVQDTLTKIKEGIQALVDNATDEAEKASTSTTSKDTSTTTGTSTTTKTSTTSSGTATQNTASSTASKTAVSLDKTVVSLDSKSTSSNKTTSTQGDGKLKAGDKATLKSGKKYYSNTYGTGTGGSKYAGTSNGVTIDSKSIKAKVTGGTNTAKNYGSYYVHIKSTDGKYADLGWVKPDELKGYAKGSKHINKDQMAWTQEKGQELIYRDADGAILTPLGQGDMVFTNEMSKRLFEIAQTGYVPDLPLPTTILPNYNVERNISEGDVNIDIGGIEMHGVNNPQEFANQFVDCLNNNTKVRKTLLTNVYGTALGRNSKLGRTI